MELKARKKIHIYICICIREVSSMVTIHDKAVGKKIYKKQTKLHLQK